MDSADMVAKLWFQIPGHFASCDNTLQCGGILCLGSNRIRDPSQDSSSWWRWAGGNCRTGGRGGVGTGTNEVSDWTLRNIGSFISGLLHPLLHRNFVQDLQNLQGNLRRRGASLSQVQVNYVEIHHSILLFIITSKFHPRKKCIPQTRGRRQEGLTRRHCSYANSLKMISTR